VDYLTLTARRTRSPAASRSASPLHADWLDLMGMLYVLDEPTFGLHPYDTRKMVGRCTACATWATVCGGGADEAIIPPPTRSSRWGRGGRTRRRGGDVRPGGDGAARSGLAHGAIPRGAARIPCRRCAAIQRAHLVIRGARENNLRDST
jgi:hypothetical protein